MESDTGRDRGRDNRDTGGESRARGEQRPQLNWHVQQPLVTKALDNAAGDAEAPYRREDVANVLAMLDLTGKAAVWTKLWYWWRARLLATTWVYVGYSLEM